jgi:RimJ/RimL family protein N-acetyltransferase
MELTLKTERLTIRDLRPDDFAEIHALRSDPEVARFMDFDPETAAQTRGWLADVVKHNQKQPRIGYNFAIVRESDSRIIGWIGIGAPSKPSGRYERELDFAYALRPPYWAQGFMTEALGAVLAFAFEKLSADFIYGECDVRNVASARVMEKAGMRLDHIGSERHRDPRFSIDAREWQAMQSTQS